MKISTLLTIVGAIALLGLGFAGGYWYGQRVILNQNEPELASATPETTVIATDADVASLLDQVKADTGIAFSDMVDKTFSWNTGDGSSVEIAGKEITATITSQTPGDSNVLGSNKQKMQDYLINNGFVENTDNIGIGTTVGGVGYTRDNIVCSVNGGYGADTGMPATSTKSIDNLDCGILN